jgi:hypothetical protein
MANIKCDGKTATDCWDCGKWRSSHSEHYDSYYDRKVSTVSCGIGGNRTFDDNGNRID